MDGKEWIEFFADETLQQMILSHPVSADGVQKVRIRPVKLKGKVMFQAEERVGTQAFHRNLTAEEYTGYVQSMLGNMRQAEAFSANGRGTLLVSKKGAVTAKLKRLTPEKSSAVSMVQEHNRQKHYLLPEGTYVPWLADLGVMTEDGQIVRTKYDKFRQINRFLEFIEDILPKLPRGRELQVIDFGCGKSYLTFAMYHYLHEMKGYPVRIVGLDLKQDVIERCNRLAQKYGFKNLTFLHGDIASYDGAKQVDMVVTLHACDTATDFALAKAVAWNASVILSVPCCQHEWNKQIHNDLLEPVLGYGLIRERMAALCTDAVRAQILEHYGYRTQILEFIDMEHTPKNILIRAVKEGACRQNAAELRAVLDFFGAEPTLARLLPL